MRNAIVLSALLLVSGWSFGQTCQQLVPQLVASSDAGATLESLGTTFRAIVGEYELSRGLSVEDRKKVQEAVNSSFGADRMSSSFRDAMMKGCDAKTYAAVLEQLKTPLYQHFDDMYKASNSPENLERKRRYIRAMAMQSPRESRVRLIDALMDASGSADLFSSAVTELTTEIIGGEYRTAPTKQESAEMKSDVFNSSRQTMESVSMFTYKAATDQELGDMTAIYGKPEMKRYVTNRNRAMLEVLRVEAHDLAGKLRKITIDSNAPAKD